MSKFLWASLSLAFAFVEVGCGQDGSCKSAGDCASGQVCELGACAEERSRPPPATRKAPEIWPDKQTGFLWRIEGPAPTYLLGTIHVGVNTSGFREPVWNALDASRILMTEVDTRGEIDAMVLQRYTRLPNGTTLDQLLPADVWTALVSRFAHIPEIELMSFEPWYVYTGFGPNPANLPKMEPALVKRFEDDQKPLAFLETEEQQLSALVAVPREVWTEAIIAVTRDPDLADRNFQDFVAAYLAANTELIIANTLGDDRYDEPLLRARNRNWIPQIQAVHSGGGGFVAVGLDHLLGRGSVIELLRTRGSTVSEVQLQ